MPTADMNRDAAWQLLTEYTQSDSLLKHAMGVEAARATTMWAERL